MDPLAQINVTIPCQDNVGSGNNPVVYSENLLLLRSQWGFLQASAYANGGFLVNGLTKTADIFCQGAEPVCGDCPASVAAIKASNGVRKWVVAVGLQPSCLSCVDGQRLQGLMVWKWVNSRYRYQGLISAFVDATPGPLFTLMDDFAHVVSSSHHTWWKFNLSTMTATEVSDLLAPIDDPQTNIAGFTYEFEKTDVQHMSFIREGAIVLPTCCPNDYTKRQQDWAVIWNTLKVLKALNPTLVIPPLSMVQHFSDMLPGNPFADATNSLAEAGIIAGKSPCQAPE